MFTAIFPKLKTRFADDQPLADFISTNYPGYELTILVGLKPDPEKGTAVPPDMFPYVAFFLATGDKPAGFPDKNRAAKLGIMFGLHDDRVLDGVVQGAAKMAEMAELIFGALTKQPIGKDPAIVWDGSAQLNLDAGVTHPWHEGEIFVDLEIRK